MLIKTCASISSGLVQLYPQFNVVTPSSLFQNISKSFFAKSLVEVSPRKATLILIFSFSFLRWGKDKSFWRTPVFQLPLFPRLSLVTSVKNRLPSEKQFCHRTIFPSNTLKCTIKSFYCIGWSHRALVLKYKAGFFLISFQLLTHDWY